MSISRIPGSAALPSNVDMLPYSCNDPLQSTKEAISIIKQQGELTNDNPLLTKAIEIMDGCRTNTDINGIVLSDGGNPQMIFPAWALFDLLSFGGGLSKLGKYAINSLQVSLSHYNLTTGTYEAYVSLVRDKDCAKRIYAHLFNKYQLPKKSVKWIGKTSKRLNAEQIQERLKYQDLFLKRVVSILNPNGKPFHPSFSKIEESLTLEKKMEMAKNGFPPDKIAQLAAIYFTYKTVDLSSATEPFSNQNQIAIANTRPDITNVKSLHDMFIEIEEDLKNNPIDTSQVPDFDLSYADKSSYSSDIIKKSCYSIADAPNAIYGKACSMFQSLSKGLPWPKNQDEEEKNPQQIRPESAENFSNDLEPSYSGLKTY